jgi:membrane protein
MAEHSRSSRRDPASHTPSDIPSAGWRRVLGRVAQQHKHDDVPDRAAALTYFGILAIFPGLLVLVSDCSDCSDGPRRNRCSTICAK